VARAVANGVTRFGDFELDACSGELRKAGRRVNLQNQPLQVLQLLLERPGDVVTRDELRQRLWSHDTFVDFERGLNAVVNRLRETLNDSADSPRFIETVPRRGYRFIAPVQSAGAIAPDGTGSKHPASRGSVWPWAVGTAVALALLGIGEGARRSSLPSERPVRAPVNAFIDIPSGIEVLLPISPDGRNLALYQTNGPDGRTVMVQPLDGSVASWLAGSQSARPHAWSPDGSEFAVVSRGELKAINVRTGVARFIAKVSEQEGYPGASAAWSKDGVILLGGSRLRRVAASGGSVTQVYSARASIVAQSWPSFLPDGRRFLFAQQSSSADESGLFIGSIDSQAVTRLLSEPGNAVVSSSGYLVFGRAGSILAQRLDLAGQRLLDAPVSLVSGAAMQAGYTQFALGADDTLVWGRATTGPAVTPTWFDRAGRSLRAAGEPGAYYQIALSPDGSQLIVDQGDGLATVDLSTGVLTRLDIDGRPKDPVWSPDGREIAFRLVDGMYRWALTSDKPAALMSSNRAACTEDWSRGGRYVLYLQCNEVRCSEIWALSLSREPPMRLVESLAMVDEPRLSPDGRWLVYSANDTGRWEVYAQPFPGMTQRRRISTNGGSQPRWRRDRKELIYLALDGTFMTVPMSPDSAFGVPQRIFLTPLNVDPVADQYDITADGQRFVLLVPADPPVQRIQVLTNWASIFERQ
jgi:DNA-binding winged helix-turn-helix (wHTH) protein/Tol biopolymer transport system component